MQALRWREATAPTHFLFLYETVVNGQHHSVAGLYPWRKDRRYPLSRRLGGPDRWSGHEGYRKNILPLPEIEHRFRHSTF